MINFSFEKREVLALVALLFIAFIVRFAFFSNQGYEEVDTQDFMVWFQTSADYGPRTFYDRTWCDYPPFNIYLFWVFGLLAKSLSLFGTSLFTYVMKLPPNLFDMATALLIFAFVRKRLDFKMALLATALYAFNPAVIFNAAVWGQFDAIYTFFLVLSLMLALSSKPELSAVTFTLGILTKPQSVALLPLIAFLIFKKHGLRRFLISLLAATATVFVVIIPFEWSNPVTFLADIYFGAYGGYAFTSVNAFNMWALGGLWMPETPVLFAIGWILFGALAAFVLYVLHKRFGASGELLVLFSAFILFFGFFMLPTRIHERYMFPALSVLALMFPFLKKTRPIYGFLSITCLVNQAYVLHFLNNTQFIQSGDLVALTVTLINLTVFIYALVLLWDELKGRSWFKISPIKIGESAKAEVEQNEHQD
ncbi:MAG: glycosyltransferase family 39 protein [Candidatus Bathyarchaeota archaeon]|nr:MAG: glycosyltransferase family 39 protein [Candidatus Bathyarchaeota archaeon]